ncbi:uncharacterized protein LOC62_01G000027 [Vanrija pseudolonga]|uniref:Uncharacterized protein n=1 Tax=Vanrija pseudolonga TaxID=143232 RepID=A0AAF0XZ05_9TREE|nr:hypothetical protein LOC62_01G000027 [Vanrija pseudolonga]
MAKPPGLALTPPELKAEWATFETYRAQDPVYSSPQRTKELETGYMKIHPWQTCNPRHLPHILLRVEGMQRVLPKSMPRESRVASVSGFMYTHPDFECLQAKDAQWPTVLAFRLDGTTLVPTPCLFCGSRVVNGVCAVPKKEVKVAAEQQSTGNPSKERDRKRRKTVADVSERIKELESEVARLRQQQTEYAKVKDTVGAQAIVSVHLTRRIDTLVTERKKEDLESRVATMLKDALAEERVRHESELARLEARLEEKHSSARAAEITELEARFKAGHTAELEAIKARVKEVIDTRMDHERGVWATAIDTWKQHERGVWATAIDSSVEDVVERCYARGDKELKNLEARLATERSAELEALEARIKTTVKAEQEQMVADLKVEREAELLVVQNSLQSQCAAGLERLNTHMKARGEELRVWQDNFTHTRTADNFSIKRNVKDVVVLCGELRDGFASLVGEVQALRAQVAAGGGSNPDGAVSATPPPSCDEVEEVMDDLATA